MYRVSPAELAVLSLLRANPDEIELPATASLFHNMLLYLLNRSLNKQL